MWMIGRYSKHVIILPKKPLVSWFGDKRAICDREGIMTEVLRVTWSSKAFHKKIQIWSHRLWNVCHAYTSFIKQTLIDWLFMLTFQGKISIIYFFSNFSMTLVLFLGPLILLFWASGDVNLLYLKLDKRLPALQWLQNHIESI